MKTFTLITFLIFITFQSFGQSYLGWVTKQVNFRQGPGTEYDIIKPLVPGTQIFIVSIVPENDFYNIIDIKTDLEGYIHKSYVKIGQFVKKNEGGIFTPSGKSDTYNSDVEIFNSTTSTLTLKMNSITYSFSPNETKKISFSPGNYEYRASAPGVIPDIGSESLVSNMIYSWKFYIVSGRR
jgi:hypothetical protein